MDSPSQISSLMLKGGSLNWLPLMQLVNSLRLVDLSENLSSSSISLRQWSMPGWLEFRSSDWGSLFTVESSRSTVQLLLQVSRFPSSYLISLKYWWRRASSAVILSAGSNLSRFMMRSISSALHWLRVSCRARNLHLLLKVKLRSTYCACSDANLEIVSAEGMPIPLRMSSNWSSVLFPGNSGHLRMSSAITQPTLHRSMESSQVVIPSSASGGRYQREATYSVSTPSLAGSLASLSLAMPKSQILMSSWLFNKILEGLMSRWTSPQRCRKAMPCSRRQAMYLRWMGCSSWQICRARARSVSMNSNTAQTCFCCGKVLEKSLSVLEPRSCCEGGFAIRVVLGWCEKPLELRCRMVSRRTMQGWWIWRRQLSSRQVRLASMRFWKASMIFLIATTRPDFLCRALYTTPYVPFPTFYKISYSLQIRQSSYSGYSIANFIMQPFLNYKPYHTPAPPPPIHAPSPLCSLYPSLDYKTPFLPRNRIIQ